MKSVRFSLKMRLKSIRFAINGLHSLLRFEHNSRIHLLATIIAVIIGIILKLNSTEWSLIIIVTGIVFITELINSALESLCDIIEPEWNEPIRKAKDYSAAAVLVAAIISILVGCIIFIPKIWDLL